MKLTFLFVTLLFSYMSYGLDSLNFKVESLLRDGAYDKAEAMLENPLFKKQDFYKLKGRLNSLQDKNAQAISFYEKAIIAGDGSESLKLLLSQELLKNNNTKSSQKALKHLEKVSTKSIQKDLLFAQALWQLGERDEAVLHLSHLKSRKYESYDLIERQKNYYLFKLSKIKQIFKNTKTYYSAPEAAPEVGIFTVNLLKEKDQHLAETYFDLLHSVRPDEALFYKERGVFELEKNRLYVASLYFEKAAHRNEKYSYEASASFLSLGKHTQALFFNSKVNDQAKKLTQLFSIYLDQGDFEKALSLQYDLIKQDLISDDKMVYALMFASFKVKDYENFDLLFSKVTSKSVLPKALKLKSFMESCKKKTEISCVFS